MSDQTTVPAISSEAAAVDLDHPLLEAIRAGVPGLTGLTIGEERGMVQVQLADACRIADVCDYLKNRAPVPFEMLVDVCGIDYWDSEPRFGLVYNLHCLSTNQRVFLKVRVPSGDPCVPTLTGLWRGADWMEREVFDLFGVRFEGHPDLRKVLTPDDLEGHPLRKDFPLGNVDVWPEGADTNTAR